MGRSTVPSKRRFQLVLLKPSHYHDDGYVIRWWRGWIPSNSLAAVYGVAVYHLARQHVRALRIEEGTANTEAA